MWPDSPVPDRLPNSGIRFVDMHLDVAGIPAEVSGNVACLVSERQATPELTGRCYDQCACGMQGQPRGLLHEGIRDV